MSTLARIATGTGETLLHRAADVCLKEKRPLILVPRETPLATHHLENMTRLSRNGAVILPAMPGFYHKPTSVDDLIDFIVQRVLNQLNIDVRLTQPWGDGA
jgi:4-hydroxy-3-polyprenylbenzoate decarboxylase